MEEKQTVQKYTYICTDQPPPLICGKNIIAEQWERMVYPISHAGGVVMHIKNLQPYTDKSIHGGLYILI